MNHTSNQRTLASISYLLVRIYQSFDDGFEIRDVLVDISKAFYKVLHEDLHSQLRQKSISGGNSLNATTDFSSHRKQKVVSNGKYCHGIVLK